MENDEIKQLFADFKPKLDDDFLTRLERNVNAVESIKAESTLLRRRFSMAISFAVVFGIATGLIASVLMPKFIIWLHNIDIQLAINGFTYDSELLQWTAIGTLSLFVAFTTYTLCLSLLVTRRKK